MLPTAFEWRKTAGQHQLWHNGRWVALVTPNRDGGVDVVLQPGHPSQTIRARGRTVAGAKRHVERWIAARLGKV